MTNNVVDSAEALFSKNAHRTTELQFRDLWNSARDVEGWLSEGQARVLYSAASLVPAGTSIVEIGSHHGRSTIFLASGKDPTVPMLAVDPFDNPRWGGGPEALHAFEFTLERFGLTGAVNSFRGVSIEASAAWSGQPIGLLFVDGAHDRASVLADIDGWAPFLAKGAVVLFHDAFSSVGVTQALTERYVLNRRYVYLGSHRSLAGFQRRDLSRSRALLSTVRLAGRYAYFLRNIAIKLALRRRSVVVPRLLKYRGVDDDLY